MSKLKEILEQICEGEKAPGVDGKLKAAAEEWLEKFDEQWGSDYDLCVEFDEDLAGAISKISPALKKAVDSWRTKWNDVDEDADQEEDALKFVNRAEKIVRKAIK